MYGARAEAWLLGYNLKLCRAARSQVWWHHCIQGHGDTETMEGNKKCGRKREKTISWKEQKLFPNCEDKKK